MPGYYDDSDIDKVREAVDIADVIGDYVNLKQKSAGDWWGLCPFHQEKTPSFHVMSARGMFHCFGCGKGGNAFTFLMEVEGVSYFEAVRTLAERTGIPLKTRRRDDGEDKSRGYKDQLFQVNRLAESWFHNNLIGKNKSREAALAYQYLADRGLPADIIRQYSLGWAESGWDGLVKLAGRSGIKVSVLTEAGLTSKRRDGMGYVDRFRSRIMFPIHNLSGKPVGFGGRRLDGVTPDDDDAKYINTSETAVYHKGEQLYGLYNARGAIRRAGFTYLVEGYTDLLALIQAGLLNTAASLGTALTQTQARLLKRFTPRIVLVYDSDDAGLTAARRVAAVLVVAGLEVRVAMLPEGEDPDSLLRTDGADSLMEVLEQHRSLVRFHLETLLNAGSEAVIGTGATQSEILSAVRGLLETIRDVKDPLQQELLLEELSEEIDIRMDVLNRALQRLRRFGRDREEIVEADRLQVPGEQIGERDLVKALLGHPDLISEIVTETPADLFRHEQLKAVYLTLEKAHLRGETLDLSSLPERFNDPRVRAFIVEGVLSGESIDLETARHEIRGAFKVLQKSDLLEKSSNLEQKLIRARKDGRSTRELLAEHLELQRKMRDV